MSGERSGIFGSRGKSTRRSNQAGIAIGSNDIRNQLMEKEQELQAIKMQAAELAEAERLEQEAIQRRERAVGYGKIAANLRRDMSPFKHCTILRCPSS
jgi:hypothetical protein